MPTNEEMYEEAIKLQQEGNLDEAVGKLRELLGQDPNYVLAHAALSKFYSDMERHDEAVEHAHKFCELEPEDPFSFVAMSLICQKAGRVMEAERALAEAQKAQLAAYHRRSE